MRHPVITALCPQCGTQFRAYVSQQRHFCSIECRAASQRGKLVPHAGIHMDPAHFWSFVDKAGDCWLWTGHRKAGGYGHISVNRRLVLAHRHAWALTHGPIPDGMFVLHHCDNPPCVRPDHLYLGTHIENARDRVARNRANPVRGENHPGAKLTTARVEQIRERAAAGESHAALAREFGVNYRTVHYIVRNKIWRHLNAS